MKIRRERLSGQFTAYHLRGPWPNHPRIHQFTGPDQGGPHSHPWPFRTTIIAGGYLDRVYRADGTFEEITRRPGDSFVVEAGAIHQITELFEADCWTFVYRLNSGEKNVRWWHYEVDEEGCLRLQGREGRPMKVTRRRIGP